MEDILDKVLEFSNYRKNIEKQKKVLKDKLISDLTIGYEGGIFRVDQSLLTFLQFLIDNNRLEHIPIIDMNFNPIIISDVTLFKDHVLEIYFLSTNRYLLEFDKLKSKRSMKDFLKDD